MTRIVLTDDLELGAATHVGRVRTSNQDDFLIHVPVRAGAAAGGRLFAIADGMGGVAGGAQASRAALRALGATLAAGTADAAARDPHQRLGAGFDAASERVHVLAEESSELADMGTTMTALLLLGRRAVVAHVGDTRCLRIRAGAVEQLTQDHAMREPRNLLTRAIGAGQRHEDVDIVDVDVRAGDVFVLVTDGVWGEVSADEIATDLRTGPLQRGCERILGRVFQAGAPDNATIVAVRVVATTVGAPRELELPSGEARVGPVETASESSRTAAFGLPYVLLAAAGLLGVLAWLRSALGFDVFEALHLR